MRKMHGLLPLPQGRILQVHLHLEGDADLLGRADGRARGGDEDSPAMHARIAGRQVIIDPGDGGLVQARGHLHLDDRIVVAGDAGPGAGPAPRARPRRNAG